MDDKFKLEDAGVYRFRRAGERHAVSPPVIQSFHSFVKTNNPDDYKKYVEQVRAFQPISFKDMLDLVPKASGPIAIDEVESIWAPIAEADDWSRFDAKIAAVREMGEALR